MFILQLREEIDLCLVFLGSVDSNNAPMMDFGKGINVSRDVVSTLERAMEERCQAMIIPPRVLFVGRNKKYWKRSPSVREQSPTISEEV